MMQIKLIDQIGYTPSGVMIDHQQWIVFCDDVQVGYLAKAPGAWLQCIVTFDDATKKELVEAINAKILSELGSVAMPVAPRKRKKRKPVDDTDASDVGQADKAGD